MKLLQDKNTHAAAAVKTVLAGLVCVSLSGCVNDAGLCPPDDTRTDGKTIWLNVHVSNQSTTSGMKAMTRADEDVETSEDCTHGERPATAAEDYIDSEDINLVLLDRNMTVLKRFDNTEYTLAGADANGNSNVLLVLPVNVDLLETPGANWKFHLAMAANKNGADPSASAVSPFEGGLADHIGDLADDTDANRFAYNPGASSWQPDIKAKRHIPMAGTVAFDIPKTVVEAGDWDADAELLMQRAMAKIRVTGNFTDKNGDLTQEIAGIESVTLCGAHTGGAVLPYYEQNKSWWHDGTMNIETASVPAGMGETIDIPFLQEGDSFICYVPEHALSKDSDGSITLDQDSEEGSGPYLSIVTVDNVPTEAGGVAERRTHKRYLSNFSSISNISRNHIYEFEVKGREMHKIGITASVLPWSQEILDYDYSGQVGVDSDNGVLEWDETTSNSELDDYFKIEVKPWTDASTNPTPLIGTFTIDSPRNCVWTASLISMTGKIDNFRFVTRGSDGEFETGEDGKFITSPTVSGIIDGRQSEICIVPMQILSDVQQEAKLQIRVQLPDVTMPDGNKLPGQIVIADVAGSGSVDGRSYHTIVQNQQ